MNWRDFLEPSFPVCAPWVGGSKLRLGVRTWTLETRPEAHGWYVFECTGRKARVLEATEPEELAHQQTGYLAGDRLVPDNLQSCPNPRQAAATWPRVYLLEPGDRFARVVVGRAYEDGPLIYVGPDFTVGAEDEVRRAYEDQLESISGIRGVTPALEVAFWLETARRLEVTRRREDAARLAAYNARFGTAQSRRQSVPADFGEAARRALALSGAQYLDHRSTTQDGQTVYIVRYAWLDRRLECVVDADLRVLDSGCCLTAEYDDRDGYERGTRGDSWFTLESLPAVLKQADDEGRLVVYRRGG